MNGNENENHRNIVWVWGEGMGSAVCKFAAAAAARMHYEDGDVDQRRRSSLCNFSHGALFVLARFRSNRRLHNNVTQSPLRRDSNRFRLGARLLARKWKASSHSNIVIINSTSSFGASRPIDRISMLSNNNKLWKLFKFNTDYHKKATRRWQSIWLSLSLGQSTLSSHLLNLLMEIGEPLARPMKARS